jgi:phosphomannomutase/phosphoglucomutase
MEKEIFRGYDIRGIYPTQINEEVAYTIGQGYGSYIQEKYNQNTCVVSHDNRLSSNSLAFSLIEGIISTGCNVIDYGLTTTPMNFYGRHANNLFGIMVTASHNPKDDNGFKFSFDHITNARGEQITNFRDYVFNGVFKKGNGTITQKDMTEEYIEYIKSGLSFGDKRRKVVIDCGNGVTCTIVRKIFEQFNIDFDIINEENDGTFPNHHPDPAVPENMKQLQQAVLDRGADLGIAYDGDGDRIGFVDEKGEIISTSKFMVIAIRDIFDKVENKTFLYDVKCSKCIEDEILKLGGTPFMYRTGASFTQAKVHEDNLAFGAEFSGHTFFRDRIFDVGSAIYASLRVCEILSKTDKKASDLCEGITKYYTSPEIKIPSPDEKKFDVIEKVKNFCIKHNFNIINIDGVKIKFDNGWALVRASNTGPNITFFAEASTAEDLEHLKQYFEKLINDFNK